MTVYIYLREVYSKDNDLCFSSFFVLDFLIELYSYFSVPQKQNQNKKQKDICNLFSFA